jgi:hypothetical protein
LKVVFNFRRSGAMLGNQNHTCKSQRLRLAEGPVCSVDRCSCGILHFNVGPLTLRLEAEAVESMWSVLGEALHRLAALEARSTTPAPRVRAAGVS